MLTIECKVRLSHVKYWEKTKIDSVRASKLSEFSFKLNSDKMVEAVLKMAVNHDKLVDFRLGQRNASNTTVSLTHGGEEAAK